MRRSTGDEAGGGEGVSAGGQSAEGSLYFLPDNLIADEVAPSQDSQLGQHDLETHETIPSLRTYSGPKETTEKLRRVRLPPPRPLPSLQPQPQPQLQHHQQQQQHQQEQQQHQQQQHQQHALPLQQLQHQQLHNDNHHLLVPTTELQDASTTGLPSLDATAYLGQQQEHHVQQPNLFEMGAVFRPIASVPPGGDHDQHATPDFGGFLGRQPEQSLQQQPQLDHHGHVILEEEEPRSRRSSNVLELLSEAMPDHHLRAPFVTGTESSLRPTAQDFEPQFARAESPLLSQTQLGASSAWQGTPFTFVPSSETQHGRTPSPPAPEQATSLRRSPANYFRSAKSLVSGAFQSNIFSPRSSYLGGSTDNGGFGDGFHVSVDTTANAPSQPKSSELESSQNASASSTSTSMPDLSASGTSFSLPRKASTSFFPWRDVGTKGSIGSDQDVRPRTSPSPAPGAGTGASSSWPDPPIDSGSQAHKSTSESTLPVMPNTKQSKGRPTHPPRTQTSSSVPGNGRESGRSTPEPSKLRGATRGDSAGPSGRSSGNANRQSSRNGRRHTAQGTPGFSGQTRSSRHPHLRRQDSPQSLNSDPSEAFSSAQASPRGRQRQHSADSAFFFGHGNTGKNRKARGGGGGASRRERQDSEPRVARSNAWTVNESPSKSSAAGSSLGGKPHHYHHHSFAADVAKHEEAANENVWAVLDSNDDEAAPELEENEMVPPDDVGATDVESEKSKALPNASSAGTAKGDEIDLLPPAKIKLAGVNAAPASSSQPSLDEPEPANADKKVGSGRRFRSRKRSSTHVPAASSHATKGSTDGNAANGSSPDEKSANDSTARRRVAHSADVRVANNKESSSSHDKMQVTSVSRKETRQVEDEEKLAPASSQENADGSSFNLWQRVCEIGAFAQGRVVELYEIGILGTRASAHAGMQGAKYVCSYVIGCHQRAASGILESGEGFHVMVCYIFLQAFAPFATTVLASTAPWAHICLWYAFLAQYLCMNETRRAAIFQFVLPVLFVLEGVSRPSYLLVLAPAELLMLAFCILILRDDRLHFNLRLLLTVSGHIIMALTVGDYFLVQWFLVVSQLDFLASTSLTKVVSSP